MSRLQSPARRWREVAAATVLVVAVTGCTSSVDQGSTSSGGGPSGAPSSPSQVAGSAPTAASDEGTFVLEEATIDQMQRALESGALTSVELTALYLNRVYAYDVNGIALNSIPVLNPDALAEAAASDARRASGEVLGPLDGIPYTVKDSYKVAGLTVASGSPAFENLTASDDAFTVEKIRAAGGVLIGKTNMPPMAAGGMQDGVYGHAKSPYSDQYLTAAWFSGSSNGSATSTAANFAAFGMGEETVSSGRSPASNNALVAYTPSRGVISIRGNWPLFPVRDVVVPHTRTVGDMFDLLNVIVQEDPITENDFWRDQTAVDLPAVAEVRPEDYTALADTGSLQGLRLGVPKMYINKDLGGTNPVHTRQSIIDLWTKAADDLRAQGAEVVEVDFPVQYNQEMDRATSRSPEERGIASPGFAGLEFGSINAYAAENFLKSVGDPDYPSWTQVPDELVFPNPEGSVADLEGREYASYMYAYGDTVAVGVPDWDDVEGLAEGLQGLEQTRKIDFEDWLEAENLDAIVFPANADIGAEKTAFDADSFEVANENGNHFSNTNYTLRLLGIPSVSVSMGLMADTAMPVNLTFAGPAYSDNDLLRYAFAYEQGTHNRQTPTRTPALDDEVIDIASTPYSAPVDRSDSDAPTLTVEGATDGALLSISGSAEDAGGISEIRVYANGRKLEAAQEGGSFTAELDLSAHQESGTAFTAAEVLVLVLAKDELGNTSAMTTVVAVPAV